MKEKRRTGGKNVTLCLLIIYLIVLTWIILFKMADIEMLRGMNLRGINLIPFAGSAVVNGKIDVSEIILNIAVFIPFGIYLSMLCQAKSAGSVGTHIGESPAGVGGKTGFVMKVLPIFAVSLMYEILQYCFAIGISDITDLLGNTLGGIIGIGLFAVFFKILGEKTVRILNILAAIGTTVVVAFLALLIAANM